MNNLFLAQAQRIIKNPNILVNMVSQRVRQLGQGHKPMIAADARMSFMDVALKEIADGKLQFEMGIAEVRGPSPKARRKKAA